MAVLLLITTRPLLLFKKIYSYFGLSFKQIPLDLKQQVAQGIPLKDIDKEGIWVLNTDYAPDRMYHNHPFYYNYSANMQALGTIYRKFRRATKKRE